MQDRVISAEGHPTSGTVTPAASAVSWAAIIAGAVVAAATALLLSTLAAGLDLASISPWQGSGISTTSAAVMTAIGLIVAHGGCIGGRKRFLVAKPGWTGRPLTRLD